MPSDSEGDPTDAPAPPRAFRPASRARSDKASTPETTARRAVEAVLPGCHVLRTLVVENRPAFRAVWQAHREKAASDAETSVIATAAVLLDAADRVPPRRLLAAEVAWKGRGYAVFVDAQRETVLGVLHEPSTWLAGIQPSA